MSRVRIVIPVSLLFHTAIPIRITDINYGGHVGNDSLLAIIHEARVQFLKHHEYEELNVGGVGLIMSDASVEFKKELFYGDVLSIGVAAGSFAKYSFDLYYLLEKENSSKTEIAVIAKTGMVCYDYENKKIAAVPEAVRQKLS